MFSLFLSILNWPALIVGAIVAYIVGAVWYHPKFLGKKWMEAQPHRTYPDDYQNSKPAMILQALAIFLLAVLISTLIALAALLILTNNTGMAAGALFAGENTEKTKIDGRYHAICILIISISHLVLA